MFAIIVEDDRRFAEFVVADRLDVAFLAWILGERGIDFKVYVVGGGATTPEGFGFGAYPHWLRPDDTFGGHRDRNPLDQVVSSTENGQ